MTEISPKNPWDALITEDPRPSSIVFERPPINLLKPKPSQEGIVWATRGATAEILDNKGHMTALFDVDGTLARGFTMGRFIEFAHTEGFGHSDYRKILMDLFRAYEEESSAYTQGKGKAPDYPKFIEETGKAFAMMLKGLNALHMRQLGTAWSIADLRNPRRLKPFAKPLIRFLRAVGIVPTLITGTPFELLEGFRQSLGIETKCHGMQFSTEGEGETARYDGEVKYPTGLAHEKAALCALIARFHRIVFAAGDQISDQPLLDAALNAKSIGDVYGAAALFRTDISAVLTLGGAFAAEENADRLQIIPDSKETTAVLRRTQRMLEDVIRDPRNLNQLNDVIKEQVRGYEF